MPQRFIVLFLIMFSLLPPGCGKDEPIRIGMVAGLSGRMSQLGVSARNGAHLAVAQVNEQGGIHGRTVELLVRDNQGSPERCGQVVSELAGLKVAGIIGPLMSKMAETVIAAQGRTPVVVISPTISADAIKDMDDYFFRIMPVASQESETMANEVARAGRKTAAVVYDISNQAYAEACFFRFKQIFDSLGGRIIYTNDMANQDRQGFARLAEEIISHQPEALYLITSGIDAAALTQQIRKRTSAIGLYGAYWVKSGNLIENGGRSVEGMIVASPFEKEVKTPEYNAFKERYRHMFNADPGFVSLYAYDAAQVLFQAIETAGDTAPDKIKQAIIDQKTFQGLEESFEINRYGDTPRAMMLLTVHDGKFTRSQE